MRPYFFPIPGHGGTILGWYVTSGKMSPIFPKFFLEGPYGSNRLYEGVNNRDVVNSIMLEMYRLKVDYYDIFCDTHVDPAIKTLCKHFKGLTRELKQDNRIPALISAHSNAAGNGRDWNKANGLCTWTDKRSIELAEEIHDRLWATGLWRTNRGVKVLKWYDPVAGRFRGQKKNIGILKGTPCYSVLPELGFHTNLEDVRTMLRPDYHEIVGKAIAEACYASSQWADWIPI